MINSIGSNPRIIEKSIFQTKEPRDAKTEIFLGLMLLSLVGTLLFAIIFAETRTGSLAYAVERGRSGEVVAGN